MLFATGRKASNLALAELSAQPKGFLEQGRVSRTRFAGSETELRAALGLQP